MSQILFAVQISFGCLQGCIPEQKLNLLQLSSAVITPGVATKPGSQRRIEGCASLCNGRLSTSAVKGSLHCKALCVPTTSRGNSLGRTQKRVELGMLADRLEPR